MSSAFLRDTEAPGLGFEIHQTEWECGMESSSRNVTERIRVTFYVLPPYDRTNVRLTLCSFLALKNQKHTHAQKPTSERNHSSMHYGLDASVHFQ